MGTRFCENLPFDYSGYLVRAVNFLYKYRWIFCSSNTKFIRNGILNSIPQDWTEDLHIASNDEFNRIPLGFIKSSWSPSFTEFLSELKQLSIQFDQHDGNPPKARKGISIKKAYEIENLASFIYKRRPPSSEIVIDFGSGLGYLSQLIHERHGTQVLGIEGNVQLVQAAQMRQTNMYPSSKGSVQYVKQFITDDSFNVIRGEVVERFPRSVQSSIVGLHACADLSISAIRCFLQCSWVKNIIIMPCCYHKMKQQDTANEQQFENLPLSEELASALANGKADIICRSFLRLGCQQTASRWKGLRNDEHLRHGRVMFRRALIDAILHDGESVKIGQLKKIPDETSIENLLEQFTLQHVTENASSVQWTDKHRAELGSLLRKYPDGHRLSEYLECLQTCIQSVCENIILLDRMCYLEQASERHGFKMSRNLVRLKNDGLSPRCFIFSASKVE